jgi:hypothetical protein
VCVCVCEYVCMRVRVCAGVFTTKGRTPKIEKK